ncbi:MAG: response regulator [Myxococcota bacterium]
MIISTNPKQALQQLGAQKVDLVLTDLCMPDMDGIEVLRHLKSMGNVPVIAMSGYEKGALRSFLKWRKSSAARQHSISRLSVKVAHGCSSYFGIVSWHAVTYIPIHSCLRRIAWRHGGFCG